MPADAQVVALLPGSRRSEIDYIAPLVLQAAALLYRQRPELRFVPPQNRYRSPVGSVDEPLRLPISDWTLADTDSGAKRILSFAFPDTPYAVLLSATSVGEIPARPV